MPKPSDFFGLDRGVAAELLSQWQPGQYRRSWATADELLAKYPPPPPGARRRRKKRRK